LVEIVGVTQSDGIVVAVAAVGQLIKIVEALA
jgi:hypothetical protein